MRAHLGAIVFYFIAGAILLGAGEMSPSQRISFWGALVCSQVWSAAAFVREAKR